MKTAASRLSLPLLFVLGAVSCAARTRETIVEPGPVESTDARARAFSLPALETPDGTPLRIWATYYTLPIADELADGVPLLDRSGQPLGPRLAPQDWCRGAMQGSVLVRRRGGDMQTYNFARLAQERQVDCTPHYPRHGKLGSTRFQRAKGRYGDGALGWPLVPYRTLAVDPKRIRLGTVLYIPAARGVSIRLPDGRRATHDGYFLAGSSGGSVDAGQVDVFIGPARKNPFAFVKSSKKSAVPAYVVNDEALRRAVRALHGLTGP